MDYNIIISKDRFTAKALLIADRLDLRKLENASHLALYPLTIRTRSGIAVLFKYGTAILFDMTPLDEAEFIESLSKYAQQVHKKPESEEIEIVVDPNVEEGPRGGSIYISSADIQRIQILAEVLSRNLILSYYESNISENFDTIEPIAKGIMERGYLRSKTTTLVKHIGSSLLSLHKMVGMVEVGDKPELLWEYPFLERLYHKLENEYELTDRRISIEKKLQIISQSAESILDLLQTNRNIRLEWYIVLLIIFEILLTLFEMFIYPLLK